VVGHISEDLDGPIFRVKKA